MGAKPARGVAMNHRLLGLALLSLTATAFADQDFPPGLTAGPHGTVLHEGQPFRGIGVNYFSAINRTVGPGDENTSYDAGFAVLEAKGIPFARVAAVPFWPSEWKLYVTDKDEYFARYDRVIASAETHHVGLILSLFWMPSAVSDLVDEPQGAWGDPDSLTIAFAKQYTKEVVSRYLTSPAIWAWEFGNEFNLGCNLPNRDQHRPRVIERLGTRTERSEADDITTPILVSAMKTIGQTIREIDGLRLISSGHSRLRPSCFHQERDNSWSRDSVAEHQEMLTKYHPDPLDLLSMHLYDVETGDYFTDQPVDVAGLLDTWCQMSQELNKPLFIGEFGAHGEGSAEKVKELLKLIAASRVPLAAVWVYDRGPQDQFNITGDNERSWILDRIGELNRGL